MTRVVFSRGVACDVRSAIARYQSYRDDGEAAFLRIFDEAVDWIEWKPTLFPLSYGGTRRVHLRNSFFRLYYLVDEDLVYVLGIFDSRQNPSWIKASLRGRSSRR